ncbi:MAG TPA: class I SAM-dependent methyltransferase [Gemmatimonadaceae bacterium]|jgi:SAM-dependent methyltransferase|nr:class I SAM-dependent methyltransferase [Gemmatimonadaceae bacterium]
MPDYFSAQAATYAAFRPTYPRELFTFVAECAPRRDLVWDCATGSGQAALALADDFARVIATDSSAKQLAHAPPHERIEYRVAPAEDSGLPDACADAITVAQALHWFDLDRFYPEVRRVLAPQGVLVIWSYNDAVLDDSSLDAELQRYNAMTVGPYWPPERQIVRDGYRTVPFPFDRIEAPPFTLTRDWTLAELSGYLRSWSATTRYISEHGTDPVVEFEQSVADRWGNPTRQRRVSWPLVVLAGR